MSAFATTPVSARAHPRRESRFAGIRRFALVGAALLGSACTNNQLQSTGNSYLTTLGTPAPKSGSDAGITIKSVLRSTVNPTGTFDILNDTDSTPGAMGTYCKDASSGSSAGASTCACVYIYTKSDGTIETFESPTTYHESDLVRCSFSGIPSSVSSVRVKLHVTDSDTYTNEFTFTFYGTGGSLDISLASSFAKATRYQCRDIISVPYALDPTAENMDTINTIYDPIQSEDPSLTFPLNFYTTNLGKTISIYAGGIGAIPAPTGWDCPANPAAQNNSDMIIYSNGSDQDEINRGTPEYARVIYAPNRAINPRSTFYLARQPSSVFTIPVNTLIAPAIPPTTFQQGGATVDSNGLTPIGYAASPVSIGNSQEVCPDPSIPVPSGYKWVKVWLFRMALPTRKYVYSNAFRNSGPIACNPGNWNYSFGDPRNSVFPECYNGPSINNAGTADQLFARMFLGVNNQTSVCAIPDYLRTANSASSITSLNLAAGSEVWFPVDTGSSSYNCALSSHNDPTHTCDNPHVPYDASSIQLLTVDNDFPDKHRYDFLFVVTPTSVHTRDMMDTGSSLYSIYTPFRFMKGSDCADGTGGPVANPDACDQTRVLRQYGVKFHDVSTIGDPPADSPNRAGTFPLCALQPTQ